VSSLFRLEVVEISSKPQTICSKAYVSVNVAKTSKSKKN
jgi:hypothetical protein